MLKKNKEREVFDKKRREWGMRMILVHKALKHRGMEGMKQAIISSLPPHH